MKNVFILFVLSLAFAASNAFADSATIGVDSQYVDRGMQLNNGPVAKLNFQLDDVFVKGIFVDTNFVTTSRHSNNISFESDLGAGYRTKLYGFDASLGAYRIFNSGRYAANYTELRGQLGYQYGLVHVYGQVGQVVGYSGNNNTYLAGGADLAVNKRLTVGALVSGYHYTGNYSNVQFNNVEAHATYNIYKGLNAFGLYSVGGHNEYGQSLGNQIVGGLSYTF